MKDTAVSFDHSGNGPDEITQLYPDLSLGDVHRALACYYDHIDEFRSTSAAEACGRLTVTRASGPSPTVSGPVL